MKILNLYSGIGGNRVYWNELGDFEITAVELDEKIAQIYKDRFPIVYSLSGKKQFITEDDFEEAE